MKSSFLILLFILLPFANFAGEKPREPFIILKVNGKIYKNGDNIPVRAGERISIEAILMGGRRDYCSNPQKYANVGKNTIIEQSGENGMSFNINGGQFQGKWTLTEEIAQFKSADVVKITTVNSGNLKRVVRLEIPQSGYSKIFLKVSSKTKWHYKRKTPAGKKEKDEENVANASFNLIINGLPNNNLNEDEFTDENQDSIETLENLKVWYSSRNIVAKGKDNFTVRNELNEVQKFYKLIEKYLQEGDKKNTEMQISNLKNYVNEVKRAINDAKQNDPEYKCEVTFIGLPSDLLMEDYNKAQSLSDKWKERYYISQQNVSRINETLLNYQNGFAANIIKSVIKNYINWGSGLPTGVENFLTLHDPNNVLGVIDLPRTIMGWYQDAENDASILKNQAQTIKKLSELRNFYLNNMANYVNERKKMIEIIHDLSYVKEKNNELKQFFTNIGWAEFKVNK